MRCASRAGDWKRRRTRLDLNRGSSQLKSITFEYTYYTTVDHRARRGMKNFRVCFLVGGVCRMYCCPLEASILLQLLLYYYTIIPLLHPVVYWLILLRCDQKVGPTTMMHAATVELSVYIFPRNLREPFVVKAINSVENVLIYCM